jgi:hypothetical protein
MPEPKTAPAPDHWLKEGGGGGGERPEPGTGQVWVLYIFIVHFTHRNMFTIGRDLIYGFLEMKLRGLVPYFHRAVSFLGIFVSNFCTMSLQCVMWFNVTGVIPDGDKAWTWISKAVTLKFAVAEICSPPAS